MTSSIGISVYPDDSDNPEDLLKHADVAMYRSKELGRNTFQFLDADLAQHRLRQHALETALRARIEGGPPEALLSADRRRRGPHGDRRRGAAALGRPGARQRLAEGLHRAGRGIGAHPLARRMGVAHRGRTVRRVAPRRARIERLGQPVGAAVLPRRHRPADLGDRAHRRLRPVVDRARGHGDEPAARPRFDPQGAASLAQRRLHRRDRRLRHRLLVAHALEALPDRHAEDRHLVHRRPRNGPGRRRDHRGDHRPRARPGPACSGGGRRDARRSSNSSRRAAAIASRATG